MSELIQTLWIGERLSALERLSLSSFIKNNHVVHLYSYEDVKNVPSGVIIKEANEIICKKDVFSLKKGSFKGSLAIFSDWFRWRLLHMRGGYWVDADVICIKPFKFREEIVFGKQSVQVPNVAVLRFPPNHYFTKHMEEISCDPNKPLPYDTTKIKRAKIKRRILGRGWDHVEWGEAGGPDGFRRALLHFNLFHLGKPYTYFYPITCENWQCIYDGTFANEFPFYKNSYALHLWNEMLRQNNIDKDRNFEENSLIERLKREYLF